MNKIIILSFILVFLLLLLLTLPALPHHACENHNQCTSRQYHDHHQGGNGQPTADMVSAFQRLEKDIGGWIWTLKNCWWRGTCYIAWTLSQSIYLTLWEVTPMARSILNQPSDELLVTEAKLLEWSHIHIKSSYSQNGADVRLLVVDGHGDSDHPSQPKCIVVGFSPHWFLNG